MYVFVSITWLVMANYQPCFLIRQFFSFFHADDLQRDFACLLPHFYTLVKQEVKEWHSIVSLAWNELKWIKIVLFDFI